MVETSEIRIRNTTEKWARHGYCMVTCFGGSNWSLVLCMAIVGLIAGKMVGCYCLDLSLCLLMDSKYRHNCLSQRI